MKRWMGQKRFALFVLMMAFPAQLAAEVQRVTVLPPEDKVWVGQKAVVQVQLRGQGPFVGAASFSLPEIPRTVMLKVGNPVVSSEKVEGDTWFVQTHEFAIFSQQDGGVKIPAFEVRFTDRDGYTGPEQDHVEQVPQIQLNVERPDGSDPATFLVTTDTLSVEEAWEPSPGKTEQGAVFHRTITQRAEQISGMALAPPPIAKLDGVRVHVDEPVIEDDTERGEFTGSRVDRMTYVIERAGELTLPAVKYVWWKPDSRQFDSVTLPAANFDVAKLPTPVDSVVKAEPLSWPLGLASAVALIGILFWQRHRVAGWLTLAFEKLNPPERRAARRLIHACRRNDAHAAEQAWAEWQTVREPNAAFDVRLSEAVTELQSYLFGPKSQQANQTAWNGLALADAFTNARAKNREKHPDRSDLPPLNPTSN